MRAMGHAGGVIAAMGRCYKRLHPTLGRPPPRDGAPAGAIHPVAIPIAAEAAPTKAGPPHQPAEASWPVFDSNYVA